MIVQADELLPRSVVLVAPAVTAIGLIQNGREDLRPLQSHFGAWVVCTDESSPYRITAYDKSGVMLADIEES